MFQNVIAMVTILRPGDDFVLRHFEISHSA